MLAGALSAVLGLGGIGISPHLIAGAGRYRIKSNGGEPETETGFHGGFGVGVGFLGTEAFAEVRFVYVNRSDGALRYVPAAIGLRF